MSKSATMKMVDGRQVICFPDGAQFFLLRNARKYAKRKGFAIPRRNSSKKGISPGTWRAIETPAQERSRVAEERRREEDRRRASEQAAHERAMERLKGTRRRRVRPSGVEVAEAGDTFESGKTKRRTDAALRDLLGRKSGRTRNPKGRLAGLPKLPAPYQYVDVTTMRDGTTVFTARVRGGEQVMGPFTLDGHSVYYNVDGFRVKSPATAAGLRRALSLCRT